MKKSMTLILSALVILLSVILGRGYALADEGYTTEIISVDVNGEQGNNWSYMPVMSADGRYVVFCSAATNLIAGTTTYGTQVFVREQSTGVVEMVSVSNDGTPGNRESCYYHQPSISADGRYVVFNSMADNLVPGNTYGIQNVFVRDRIAGTTEIVSVNDNGEFGDDTSWIQTISNDGRFVAFESQATNLVGDDTNNTWDVFVHDRQTGTTVRASVDSTGAEVNSPSRYPSISPDGKYVAFVSWANLMPEDPDAAWGGLFLRDIATGAMEFIALGSNSSGTNMINKMSADNRYIVFHSGTANLVENDHNGVTDVFRFDRVSGTMELVSVMSDGTQGNGASVGASISADGRYVAFSSAATNFTSSDNNYGAVFVRDMVTGSIELASGNIDGVPANDVIQYSVISPDGKYVLFESRATDLVPDDTNGTIQDVFIHKLSTRSDRDMIGIFVDGQWYIDLNGTGEWEGSPPDSLDVFGVGLMGALPVTGDWNGDGTTEIGVYDPVTFIWYLDYNGNGVWDGTPTDRTGYHGFVGALPVTGDWNDDGITEIGIYDPPTAVWYLDYNGSGAWDGTPTDKTAWYGYVEALPVTGDWNDDGTTEIGVYDPNTAVWYLDFNGNGGWDGTTGGDVSYSFGGQLNAKPVSGKWN